MKKWMYVVFPGIMLGAFLVLYFGHEKEAAERERVRTEQVAQKLAAEKKQKEEAEAKAQADAQKRAKEREEEDRKKEEERRKKQQAIDDEIRDKTNQFLAEGDKSSKEAAQLEIELDRLHKQKDAMSREAFELAKQVELAKVAKRNAEIEQQRLTEMIARKANDSAIAKMPPPPPAVK